MVLRQLQSEYNNYYNIVDFLSVDNACSDSLFQWLTYKFKPQVLQPSLPYTALVSLCCDL